MAETALAKAPVTQVEIATDRGKVSLSLREVTNLLCKDATDVEAMLFMRWCQSRGLDPFAGEAHLIKYGPNGPASMVAGWQVFLRRAQRNAKYRGHRAGVIRKDGAKVTAVEADWAEVIGGWAEVLMDYGGPEPFSVGMEVSREEAVKLTRGGEPTKPWKEQPKTMMRKVALERALREAAPEELAGMYAPEEMGVLDNGGEIIEAEVEVVAEDDANGGTQNDAAPVAGEGEPCECGQGTMRLRQGKRGPFLGCTEYRNGCKNTIDIKVENPDELPPGEQAQAEVESEPEADAQAELPTEDAENARCPAELWQALLKARNGVLRAGGASKPLPERNITTKEATENYINPWLAEIRELDKQKQEAR